MDTPGNNKQEYLIPAAAMEENHKIITEERSAANESLVGFQFRPTDEQLITHYLMNKINNNPIIPPTDIINVAEVYKYNPQTLSEKYPGFENEDWYFFTPRERKYPNGTRPSRAAGNGFWKPTGKDKPIQLNGKTIGFRKGLTFYEVNIINDHKTREWSDWKMIEYRVDQPPRPKTNPDDMRLDDWVLCHIYKKKSRVNPVEQTQPEASHLNGSTMPMQINSDNCEICSIPMQNDFHGLDDNFHPCILDSLSHFDLPMTGDGSNYLDDNQLTPKRRRM